MHFLETELADEARGMCSARSAEIQTHLTACSKCRKSVDIWKGIREAAETRTPSAPDRSIRMVKSAFAMHRPRAVSRLAQVATLLFDSLLEPAAQEGVRGSYTVPVENTRQLLYRGGSYVVDLRMEPQAGSNSVVLVGQVLNLSREGGSPSAVRVVLERGRAVVAAAVANEFGEFVLEFEEKGEMRLRVETLGQKPLIIPLGDTGGAI